MDQKRISSAVDACYDAALDPETWPDALHKLARALDAVCAMFYPENPSGRLLSVPASRDYGDFLDDYVKGGWYADHYRAERGWPLVKRGKSVVIEHDLASDEERRRLRHYNDLYLRWGFPGFAMIGFELDGQHWGVPLLRAASQGHFTPEETGALSPLAPHFRRMIRLSERLAADRASAGLQALESVGGAAVIVGPNGRVVGMNRNAEKLLGNGLCVWNGFLETSDHAARDRLYRLIASTCHMEKASDLPCGPVVVRRPETRPLVLEAFPARGLLADVFQGNGALILVTDMAEGRGPAPRRLQAVFGLTPAEARLVSLICEGRDMTEAARTLGISIHTARSQIKSAFVKTGAGRQAELVALATRIGGRAAP